MTSTGKEGFTWAKCNRTKPCVPECGAVIFCAVAVSPETSAWLFFPVPRGENCDVVAGRYTENDWVSQSDEMLPSKQKVLTYVGWIRLCTAGFPLSVGKQSVFLALVCE